MEKLIAKLISTNFADLEGLQITGSVPVKQELLNEAISEVLTGGLPTSTSNAPATTAAGTPPTSKSSLLSGLNVNDLLKLVKKAEVTAHEGEIRLEFEIRR